MTVLLAAAAVFGQSRRAEFFDTSGMPRRPANFVEQQISEMIATHTQGNLADAARIQRKLGRYYADNGDEKRATAAFLAAAEAEKPAQSQPEPAERPAPSLSGSYYGYDGRTLHTWELDENGKFLHTWIVSGAGTSVRNSERGSYRVMGDVLELRLASTASGFVTPGVGGRSTLAGGGAGERAEARRVKLVRSGVLIELDGVKLKPKSW